MVRRFNRCILQYAIIICLIFLSGCSKRLSGTYTTAFGMGSLSFESNGSFTEYEPVMKSIDSGEYHIDGNKIELKYTSKGKASSPEEKFFLKAAASSGHYSISSDGYIVKTALLEDDGNTINWDGIQYFSSK